MDDQIEGAFLPKYPFQRLAVAHIDIVGPKVSRGLLQTPQVPEGVTLRAEKVGSHVVVGSDHRLRALIEVADQLGTYQSA